MDRQEIIDEIRRMAKANDGVAPGSYRFQSTTGLPETAWKGRYWARWSDALVEAGLTPNSFQARYDDLAVLEYLSGVVQELDRWPSQADLRLHAKQNPGSPATTTVKRRGSPGELAQMLLDNREELGLSNSVVAICETRAAANPIRSESPQSETQVTEGYVLKSGKYYKIGRSNDPGRRAYEVRLQLPEPVTEVHKIRTDDPEGIEAYWHRRFAERRANGEWFALTSTDVSAFRSRRSM